MSAQEAKTAAWTALAQAARDFTADKGKAQALADAAEAWGKAKRAAAAPASEGFAIPFGRSKGTPISQATEKDLEWVADALVRSIADPAKERWKRGNEALLEAIQDELANR